jgi:hypothetical protein
MSEWRMQPPLCIKHLYIRKVSGIAESFAEFFALFGKLENGDRWTARFSFTAAMELP